MKWYLTKRTETVRRICKEVWSKVGDNGIPVLFSVGENNIEIEFRNL